MNRNGKVTTGTDGPAVEFERVLSAPVSMVWEMLTTSSGLGRWLAPASVDLRAGGFIVVDFGDEGGRAGGEILELVPQRSVEYRWEIEGEPESVVRFELQPLDEATTRLRLHHRLLPPDQAIGYGAGWHAHLDQLEQAVTSGHEIDWSERFDEVLPHYQRQRI